MNLVYGMFRVSTLKGRFLLWAGTLVLAMSLIIVLCFSAIVYTTKAKEMNSTLQQAVNLQSEFIDQWKTERLSNVRYLARLPEVERGEKDKIKNTFTLFLEEHNEFSTISLADAQGTIQINPNGDTGATVTDRDYFKAALRNEVFVSDVLIGKISGKSIVVFSAPFQTDGGDVGGAVLGVVELDTLDQIMNKFRLGETGRTYLLNQSGYRITKWDKDSGEKRISRKYATEIYERAVRNQIDTSAYRNPDGESVFGAYAWTRDRQWILVGEINSSEVFRPYFTMIKLMAAITLGILMVSYMAAMLMARRIEGLLQHMLQGTKLIREGRFGYRIDPNMIASAPVELRELSNHFNIMSEKLEQTMRLLEESAVVDHLTEVYNRRFLMNEGNKMLLASIRGGHPCCVLLVDVDHFKQVNDRYGHLVGDRVLRHVASVLVGCVRHSDVVARYGGEEFVIAAVNCDLAQGRELGERIRSWVSGSPYLEEGIELQLTVSIGVAQNRPDVTYGTNNLEDMIERADKALYRAKHRGRNRVETELQGV